MHLGEWIIDINYYKICAKNNFSSPEIIGGGTPCSMGSTPLSVSRNMTDGNEIAIATADLVFLTTRSSSKLHAGD